ncbi:MAG: SusC/RagA family TonB-linked outer membrane protein, partial [Bacteroidales bacterium]|nr:SusC/RagA family TonB-linked outer membrane protein [Bacteroidales bacterium]
MKRLKQKFHGQFIMIGMLALFILLSGNNLVNGQKITVTGTVTDESTGVLLPGANIIIKGTTTGTVTDVDGKYSIEVDGPSSILVFSYIGYQEKELEVGNQTIINVALVAETEELDEVVVIGYGVQKKKLVTGATTQLKNEDFIKNNVTRVESSLQGLTPGMVIVKKSGQPGSDYNITIRGLSSPNGNDPLVLIDGVPGELKSLNPSDIETIDVLKDAASAAIYGSRAANGVILITTKKGKKGESVITYDAYYGVSTSTRKVEMLNAKEYAMLMNEASFNTVPSRELPFTQEYIDNLGEGTDWQEEALNKKDVFPFNLLGISGAPTQSHYLGITGGGDVSNYSISLSYNNEEGIYSIEDKSDYERVGFRINSEHKVKKYLKLGENLTFAHRYSRGLGVTSIYNNIMRDLLQASPLIDAYDPSYYDGFGKSEFNEDQMNPIASMHYNYNDITKNDDLIGDIYAELEIIKGLKFRTDFGGTLKFENKSNATDTFTLTPTNYKSIPNYKQDMKREFFYNFDNVLSYEANYGKHNFLALVGMNAQDNYFFKVEANIDGYLSNVEPVLTNVTTRDTAFIKGDFGKGDSRFSY